MRAKTIGVYTVSMVRDRSVPGIPDETPITEPSAVMDLVRPLYAGRDREVFSVVLMDARHRPIGINQVSVGTVSAALVHPREVFKPAIVIGASSFIAVHNHPSGDLAPSEEDIALTRRLREAGELLGIELLDSIIVDLPATNQYSMKKAGLL